MAKKIVKAGDDQKETSSFVTTGSEYGGILSNPTLSGRGIIIGEENVFVPARGFHKLTPEAVKALKESLEYPSVQAVFDMRLLEFRELKDSDEVVDKPKVDAPKTLTDPTVKGASEAAIKEIKAAGTAAL